MIDNTMGDDDATERPAGKLRTGLAKALSKALRTPGTGRLFDGARRTPAGASFAPSAAADGVYSPPSGGGPINNAHD